jgi:hypothetical protein
VKLANILGQKRRPTSTCVKIAARETEGGSSDRVLEAGQKVSVDLYLSSILGRVPHTKREKPDDEKYSGGAIFSILHRSSSS